MPTIKDIMPESVFTIALSTGIQGRRGVPGPIGPQGVEGPQGEPGKDYVLTKEDKEEITDVLDRIYKERIDIITPKNTSKGELVHITDGLPLPIYKTKVDGNVEQETTSGINLANILDTVSGTSGSGLTSIKNNDGTLSVKGTTSRAWDYTISQPINFEAGKTYSLSVPKFEKTSSSKNIVFYLNFSAANGGQKSFSAEYAVTGKPVVFTINENETQALKFSMGANSEIDYTAGIQVQEGNITKMPEFEKGTNGASPNPTYPQPIEVVTGITNLFDGQLELGNFNSSTGTKLEATDYLINKNPIKVEELTKYKISLEGKGLRVYLFEYKGDMTYNLTTRKTINETSYISTEKGTKYINFRTIETNKNTNAKILLEKGAYINKYVPYGNNMNISNIGKNLLNISLIQRNGSYSYGNTGTIPTYTGGTSRATLSPEKAIIVKPNASYTLTIPSGIRVAIAQLESDLKSLGDSGWQSSSTYTFTTKSNAKYVGFNFSKTDNSNFTDDDWNNFINSNLQFELGQATSYEPYQSNQLIINIGNDFLGKIGNVKDELIIENNKVKLIKRIGKIVLDGSENWIVNTTYTNEYMVLKSEIGLNLSQGSIQFLSNYFTASLTAPTPNGNIRIGGSYLCVNYDNGSGGASNFKTWLSNNNVEVYYILAEPYTIELGELENTIKTFEGTNNIQLLSNISTEIEVKYAVDLKKYTDNKLAEISAQII